MFMLESEKTLLGKSSMSAIKLADGREQQERNAQRPDISTTKESLADRGSRDEDQALGEEELHK
jgi:hypothetical protein